MTRTSGYGEIFRLAGQRWLDGDAAAISEFERGIALALEEGDLAAALAAHQKLLVWKPEDVALHKRVAQAIAAARDRSEAAGLPAGVESIPLFSGVPREELASLLTVVAPLKVSDGSVVVREGEPGDSLFLVVSGRLRVSTRGESGEEVLLGALAAGDFFGEVSLLTDRPRTATVTAIGDSELLRLDRSTVNQLRRSHPEIDTSLSEFHRRRAERTVEALIERRKKN
jgi:hypothetical protein